MADSYDVIVAGSGIFGVTAALTLQERGHKVALFDPGPLPHPLAASTDISKVIRMEYGSDEHYMTLVEQALDGWHRWNEMFGEDLYYEVGVMMVARDPMSAGGYEYESWALMQKRGHSPERLDSDAIRQRFPAWNADRYVDGYYHARGGWAESGRVIAALVEHAQRVGVTLYGEQAVTEVLKEDGRVTGVRTASGDEYQADIVIVAAGVWTIQLIPELASLIRITGHPVFHLKTTDPDTFTPPRFTVFTADIAKSGWYGFPLHPHEGVIKIANHGAGQSLGPDDERVVTAEDEAHLRAFLADTFPSLVDAPIVYTRRCLYCDTLDGDFVIDQHPDVKGLFVSTGGSGHGFKFGPVLGMLTADVVEGKSNPALGRFGWRSEAWAKMDGEEARYKEQKS